MPSRLNDSASIAAIVVLPSPGDAEVTTMKSIAPSRICGSRFARRMRAADEASPSTNAPVGRLLSERSGGIRPSTG